MTATLIQFKTKEEFRNLKKIYENTSSSCWKMYMYNFFKNETWCYYIEEDCFISLEKAIKLNLLTNQTK